MNLEVLECRCGVLGSGGQVTGFSRFFRVLVEEHNWSETLGPWSVSFQLEYD